MLLIHKYHILMKTYLLKCLFVFNDLNTEDVGTIPDYVLYEENIQIPSNVNDRLKVPISSEIQKCNWRHEM